MNAESSARRALRVCLLTETYLPLVGGGETQARLLAESLTARGHRVEIVTRRHDRDLEKRAASGGVAVRRLPPAGSPRLARWGLALTAFGALLSTRRSFDVVYVSGFRALGLPAVIASRLRGAACVLKADSLGEMSGEFFRTGLERWGMRPDSALVRSGVSLRNALLRRADAFVAISSPIAAELHASAVAPGRIREIPNCVDTDRFAPASAAERAERRAAAGIPGDATVITFTGRLVSYKGLAPLLESWSQLAGEDPRLRLRIVGSGGLDMRACESELVRYVAQRHLESSVTFTGAVDAVEKELQAADVYVFPSERESFGISLVEAMACGLPSVSTAAGGLADIVADGVTGLVIAPNDRSGLRRALRRLIKDRELAGKLGDNARRVALERYSAPAVVERLESLFYGLVDRENLPRPAG